MVVVSESNHEDDLIKLGLNVLSHHTGNWLNDQFAAQKSIEIENLN